MMITSRTSLTLAPRLSGPLCDPHHRERIGSPWCSDGRGLETSVIRQKGRMTTTMSIDELRELAGFRAENGCAISLYLNLDPGVSPTAADVATRVRSLLDAGAKSHGATRGDLPHESRQGLRNDFERIERYFEQD